jgi:nitroreductase
MNHTLEILQARKSVRSFQDKPIPEEMRQLILDATMRAPTAGNQMLYTIIDVRDQSIKEELALLCDHQPFIARAAMVLIFLADCRRWQDCYEAAHIASRRPGPGDLLLACEDAIIAAQTSVIAAESLGLGSCYIGDILEDAEKLRRLLDLDDLVMPACMVVYGYPTVQATARQQPPRFAQDCIVMTDRYHRLPEARLRSMIQDSHPGEDFDTWVHAFCTRKYLSAFCLEMNRSARIYIESFLGGQHS